MRLNADWRISTSPIMPRQKDSAKYQGIINEAQHTDEEFLPIGTQTEQSKSQVPLYLNLLFTKTQRRVSQRDETNLIMSANSLSILCFGDSLTEGFHTWGIYKHPYADELVDVLEKRFPSLRLKITADVAGKPGDTAVYAKGSLERGTFLPRIQLKCDKKKYDWVIVLGGTNDLAFRHDAKKIYAALQDCWNVALESGAKVLALTIPECDSTIKDKERSELNTLILDTKMDRFYSFDLRTKIPYRGSSDEFIERIFDDGLHLTAEGYDLMGRSIGLHLAEILKAEGTIADLAPEGEASK
ncbi:SGNH hydrolase [Penicillium verhagenii]|nr:SGNH hydrolase [Penicillium verhagenii]